jgi:hypothetical protein
MKLLAVCCYVIGMVLVILALLTLPLGIFAGLVGGPILVIAYYTFRAGNRLWDAGKPSRV